MKIKASKKQAKHLKVINRRKAIHKILGVKANCLNTSNPLLQGKVFEVYTF